jgi:hypothetical protein
MKSLKVAIWSKEENWVCEIDMRIERPLKTPRQHQGVQQSRFSSKSCLPEDTNRSNFQNVVVLMNPHINKTR